ncbi:dipeptide/oligopeptide/nickel ABC transporter ATP-binding protein, partial [Streptomyces sp. TX20-6-3]|nr:dipeptide/oligopeptide/nickel ABC transporter ATP-binding protein [Streptomyces sp. TX20-6-3]
DICRTAEPPLVELRPGQRVACHHPENAESLTIPGARESVEITTPKPEPEPAPEPTPEPTPEPEPKTETPSEPKTPESPATPAAAEDDAPKA